MMMHIPQFFQNLSVRMRAFLHDQTGQHKLPILRSPIFLIVLGIKIVLAALFASQIFTEEYIPFVDYFVSSGFGNPYEHFATTLAFPYPGLMLVILAIPRLLFAPLFYLDSSFIEIFVYRLPILAADFGIFVILARWLKTKQNGVLLLYWCSPVLIYINYVYGQLDAVPMALLFGFLYFLFKEKLLWATVFLSLCLVTKTGMILAFPFIAAYIWLRRFSLWHILLLLGTPVLFFFIFHAGVVRDPNFISTIMHMPDQQKIFDWHYTLPGGLTLYFAPIIYLILLVKSLAYRQYNRDMFLMFLGFSFGILTLFLPPLPGWYWWIIPFFVYFYVKQKDASILPLLLLQIFYFGYFLFAKDADVWTIFHLVSPALASALPLYAVLSQHGVNADVISNLFFSLLQGTLLLNIIWIYRKGIESAVRYKISYQPYLIGVAGDSGSGKSVLSKLLTKIFGERSTLVIAGDDMHKWERGDAHWTELTHLNPRANRLHSDLEQALELRAGNGIFRRLYDHATGKFTAPEKIHSKNIIVFQGLHSFYLERMKHLLDLKIYVHPAEELRRYWKVQRDMKERGHALEKILEQIAARTEDALQFVQNQLQHADIVIALYNTEPINNLAAEQPIPLGLKITCNNAIDLEPLLLELTTYPTLRMKHEYHDTKQTVNLCGEIPTAAVHDMALRLTPEIWDVAKSTPEWEKEYNALIQLFIGYYIFSQMKTYERSSAHHA